MLHNFDYIVLPHEVYIGGNELLERISHHDQVPKLYCETRSDRQRLCLSERTFYPVMLG